MERWDGYTLLQCSRCDLQLWSPPLAADSAWYDTSDHYLAMAVVDWLGWYHRWGLSRVPPEARALLDVGCADGRFVYAAAGRGLDARGIDFARGVVEQGNRRHGGARLTCRSLEDLTREGAVFDVVTLFEVIEHVPDPLALLSQVRPVLRRGGTLIVSTPNRLGRPRPPVRYDRPPHHLTRWSPRALRFTLDRAGFDVVEMGFSPPRVGLAAYLLGRVRFGIAVGILRRRARASSADPGRSADVRALIRAKSFVADAVAAVLAPFVRRWFSGGSMVCVARERGGR